MVVEEAGPDGLPWIVMEWIPGESLHEVLRRGPVTASEAARVGLAVLGALRAAHAVGIVHRAVRPANVLLGPHGRVVLTDFGTAHVPGEESLRGAGPAADLRSLGALLHTAVGDGSPAGPLGPLGSLIERLRAEDAGRRPDAEEVAKHLEAVATRDGPGQPSSTGTGPVRDLQPDLQPDRQSDRRPVRQSDRAEVNRSGASM